MKTTLPHPSLERPTIDAGSARRRPRALWLLIPLMVLLSVSGFYGGIAMLRDTSGAVLQAKLSWLDHAPVHTYLLPGLFLLGVYGIGVLVLIAGLLWRPQPGPIVRLDANLGHHWAWVGTIAVGVVLVLWIVYEFFVLPDVLWLQPALIGLGLVMVGTPMLRSMREWYATG
jgi:hypothetical protein